MTEKSWSNVMKEPTHMTMRLMTLNGGLARDRPRTLKIIAPIDDNKTTVDTAPEPLKNSGRSA